MKIKSFLLNLKFSRKMFFGFTVMIIIMVVIMLSGLLGFKNINERIEKNALSVELMNNLSAAKLSRVTYEYTEDDKYVNQNKLAMNNLSKILDKLYTYQWSESGVALLDKAQRDLKNYFTGRAAFDVVLQKKREIKKRLNNRDFYQKSTELNAWSLDTTLPVEQRMMLAQLSFVASDLDSLMGEYLEQPTETLQQRVQVRIDDGVKNAEQLQYIPASDQRVNIKGIIQDIHNYAENIEPYHLVGEALEKASASLSADAAELGQVINELHSLMQKRVQEVSHTASLQMELVALIGIFVGIVLAWLITQSITTPLKQTLLLAEQIADGDLTHELQTERRDELGLLMQSMSTMNTNLKNIIHDVREGVDCVARSSSEIASGNMDLSSRTEQQAAAVVETAASMDELTSTIANNADNANEALKLSEIAAKKAGEGCQISQALIESMKNVQMSSHRISEITTVINGIAFQTNILALNAAVEAARAGEQGKGFAVVAGEVRNLAQRSAQSAKEIEELIKESVGHVDSGFTLVERAGVAIADIEHSVTQMKNIMSDIAVATDEQSRGVSQIAQAMTEMDTTTQQNAALVEESSAAASSLEDQALKLEEAIAVFRITHDKPEIRHQVASIRKIHTQVEKQNESADGWVKF
ncbi:TPA: methyl-accepting chemotaxis protein [Citrobacter gillenii]